jgi:hypothetical protein
LEDPLLGKAFGGEVKELSEDVAEHFIYYVNIIVQQINFISITIFSTIKAK